MILGFNMKNCLQLGKFLITRNLWKHGWQNFHSMKYPLQFQCSPILNAEPLKKKKRVDPGALREKMEKRIKRISKEIRRHEKVARKLKPIFELEVPKQILKDTGKEGETWKRPPVILSEEEETYRRELCKEWREYKRIQHVNEMNMVHRVMAAQERALDALKEASPELYDQALQIDPLIFPFTMTGPVETPPIKDHDYPEGEYKDVTKEYLPIVTSEPTKTKSFRQKKVN